MSAAGRPKEKYTPVLKLSEGFSDTFFDALKRGRVELDGLGTFEIKRIPAKRSFHNFSKKIKVFPAYNKLKFTQSAELKERLSKS